MKYKYNKYNPYTPPWLRRIKAVAHQLILPFAIFQGIRTLILPTTFDVVLLAIFVLIAVALYMELI